jgi:hypothetical protein
LIDAIDLTVTIFNVNSGASKTDLLSATSYVNHAVASGAIGLALLLGAPLIASMFYAPTSKPTQSSQ